MAVAFGDNKRAMLNAAELAHPLPGAELSLAVDTSGSHVGAVLQQRPLGGQLRLLAYFSVKLDRAQVGYSAFDRELLACYLSIKHFCWMLEARPLHVWTDHKPLVFALQNASEGRSARQLRHLSFVA